MESVEFGLFEDLSETDQAYIREILTSKRNSTKVACKGLKKPEFAWINDATSTAKSETLSDNVEEQHIGEVPVDTLQAHPVPVMSNIAFPPPQMQLPVGFGPYISTYPPGMIPAVQGPHGGMVPVFMQPTTVYSIPVTVPPPGPTIPVGIPIDQVIGSNVPQFQSNSVNEVESFNESEEQNDQKDDDKAGEAKSGKTYERRNKKRRPRDYYERLAAQEKEKSEVTENSLCTVENMQRQTVNIGLNERTSETNNFDGYICSVPLQNTAQSIGASTDTTLHHVQEAVYAQSNSSQTNNVASLETTAIEDISSSQSQPQTTCDNKLDRNGDNISAEHLSHAHTSPQPSIVNSNVPVSPGEVMTSSSSSDINSQVVEDIVEEPVKVMTNVESGQSEDKTLISDLNSQGTLKQEQLDKSVTNRQTKEDSNSQTDKQISNYSGNTQLLKPNETKSSAKKGSWAGLFSETQQAKNATVVYIDTSKTDSDKVKSDSKLGEEIPVVVPPKDDHLVHDIGEILINHHLNHKVISLQPRGLRNRRNWCYVSATLQALLACPPFYHLMKALPYSPHQKRGPSSTPVMDCLCDFVNQFSYLPPRAIVESQKALNGKGTMRVDIPQGPTFEPTYVYDVLKTAKYASAFLYGRQEDAEEFLSCFLNGLHDEMVACIKSVKKDNNTDATCNGVSKPIESTAGVGKEEEEEEEEEGWEQVGPRNKAVITRATDSPSSPISCLFQGQIRSILHQAGVRESATLQPFFTLQLDIQSDKVWNVRDALDGLAKKESLQDYTCTKTKQEVEATRRITLEDLPPVLILHLKYFLYDKNGGCQKLSKPVDFGIDLEISKDLLSPNVKSKLSQNQRKYKLFGVVNHHGARALGGHYTTYVFHVGINGWVHIDDEIIRTVSAAQVLKHSPPKVPYLLYYRKVDV